MSQRDVEATKSPAVASSEWLYFTERGSGPPLLLMHRLMVASNDAGGMGMRTLCACLAAAVLLVVVKVVKVALGH